MRRQPAYALTTIAILALGIGINAAIFEAADAVLIRSRPFVAPENVFALEHASALQIGPEPQHHAPHVADWAAGSELFESVAGFARGAGNVRSSLGVERDNVTLVTPRFFSVVGRSPVIGRSFRAGDEVRGRASIAIISDGLWRREFGAAATAVGSAIEISGRRYTIVGVMPPEFTYPAETEVWLPLTDPFDFGQFDLMRVLVKETVIARVHPASARAQVQAAADAVVQRVSGAPNAGEDRVLALPIREELSKGRRATFALLLGMGILLFAVAVANVANLILVRSTTRVDEIRVRAALGASSARIAGELTAEPLLLACIGGGVGVLGARWILRALIGLHVVTREELAAGGLSGLASTVVVGLTIASGLVAGAVSVAALRRRLARSLLSTYEARGPQQARARANLLAMQVALAFVLVAGSTLLARSLRAMLDQDVELHRSAMTADVSLAPELFPTPAALCRIADAILERVRRDPDVRHLGVVSNLPLSGGAEVTVPFDLPGKHLPASRMGDVQAEEEAVSPGYFAAMGIPVTRGRDFSQIDVAGAPLVAIISEDLADRFWPGADALGGWIAFGGDTTRHTIVGIVRSVRAYRLTQKRVPQVYFPFAQHPSKNFGVVVEAAKDEAEMARELRDAVRAVDLSVPVYRVRSFAQVRLDSVAPESSRAILLSAFAFLALMLAASGVYGTTAYLVTDRTREIGVRIALGAPRGAIVQLAMREGARAAGIGIVVGVAASLALGRAMSALLYGVTASDPETFVSAAAGLALLALLAALVPASRALRVDPVDALRHE